MEPDDPLAWMMTDVCQLSSSEDSSLRGCSFFGISDSDDSSDDSDSAFGRRHPPDIPVSPFGITMVSPPVSPEDELPNDRYVVPEDQEIFHTPPESRSTSTSYDNCNDGRMIGDGLGLDGEALLVDADDADSGRVVDLGRDTGLGFSELEVDSTRRIEANSDPDGTFPMESEEIRVSKRGFSPKRQLSTEYPSKRLKSLDFEWQSEPGGGSLTKERLDLSIEVIGSDTEERNIERENNNVEVSSSGKTLDSGDIESDTEERNLESGNGNGEGNSGTNKNIVEDIDQLRYTSGNGLNSNVMEETEGKRALPSWANNVRMEDDESADKELEVSETEVPSWANGKAGVDERADELEVNELELPSWVNGTGEDDERVDEEREVNETELPSQPNDGVGDDERADEEMEVNETESPWSANDRARADKRADEKLEVNEMALPSWANGTTGDNERADEELGVNDMELPLLSIGGVGDDERVDEEVDVNERDTVHLERDSASLSEDFEEATHSDVLLKLEGGCEEDRGLECLLRLIEADKRAEKKLEVNETELLSWANVTVGDDERADEKREVNGRELPSKADDRSGDDERADEEMEVNEMESPWSVNERVRADERADEKLEDNEMELPSRANGRAGDEERADEELEVNKMELPSLANGSVGYDERVDEELDVNERETVRLEMDSDSLSEDFEEVTHSDVLLNLEEDCEKDRGLECLLSLLEVAERNWGTFSSDELLVAGRN